MRANDTRPEVGDQIKSLGGEFVPVDYVEEGTGVGGYAKVMSEGFQKAQREVFAKQAKEVDIIITTALIPGKPAPKLITADMVQSMKPGSVIVDMAAEQGGNCELTEPGKIVVRTASPSSDTPICQAGCRARRAISTRPTCSAYPRNCQGEGRPVPRRHGGRGDPRHDRGQGGRGHLAAAGPEAVRRASGAGAQKPAVKPAPRPRATVTAAVSRWRRARRR